MSGRRPRLRGALPSVALSLGLVALALAGSSGAGAPDVGPSVTPAELSRQSAEARRSGCVDIPATKAYWDDRHDMNRIDAPRGLHVCGTAGAEYIQASGNNIIWARQGDDVINAKNGVKDRKIDAGGGRDTVYADKCDRVVFAETIPEPRGSCKKKPGAR
jgi:hypothetical protein